MAGGQNAAALAVGDHRQPQLLGGLPGGVLGATQPHIRAEHQDRPCAARQQGRDPADVPGIRRRGGRDGHEAGMAVVAGRSASACPNSASSAKSRNTGPRCGVSASRNAASTAAAMPAVRAR